MPIYEYKCHQCGHELEALQKISDSPLTECPNCGKNTLDKVISATQFQLKGSGWYASDFKSATNSTEQKSEPKASSSESK
jgi:putative FmdB family regulatory protein